MEYFIGWGKEVEKRITVSHKYSNNLIMTLQSNIEMTSVFGQAYDRMNAIFQVDMHLLKILTLTFSMLLYYCSVVLFLLTSINL